MRIIIILVLITNIACFTSCKKEIEFNISAPEKLQINQQLNANVNLKNDDQTTITYALDDIIVGHTAILNLNIKNYKLGQHTLKATVQSGEQSHSKEQTITFLADKKPEIYTYKVINTYPHNRKSYTQGFEFYNNELYEGTGKRGQSVLRKIDLLTGKTLKEQPLANKYFGEGITIFNNKIYQLTWQSKIGFVYDINTFKTLKTFNYHKSLQGWGLTHNHNSLIKSDGTEKIWFLDPETAKEKDYIQVYTNKKHLTDINELEYFNDRIYANIWTYNAIAIINPKNGMVEALVNMKGLAKQLDNKNIVNSKDNVLNGIAYNPKNKKLYVTGKNWDKVFEIEIIK